MKIEKLIVKKKSRNPSRSRIRIYRLYWRPCRRLCRQAEPRRARPRQADAGYRRKRKQSGRRGSEKAASALKGRAGALGQAEDPADMDHG